MSTWQQLRDVPVATIVSPLVLNRNEFVLVPYTDCDGLYKYSILEDKWVEWLSYPKELPTSRYHTVSINKDKTRLYIFNEEGRIIEIDLIKHKFKVSLNKYHDGSHVASVVINKEFNIFGGWHENDKAHFIWNTDKQTLERKRDFIEFRSELRELSAIYIESRNSVLIIRSYCELLYLYSIKSNKIIELPMKFDNKDLYTTGCIKTTNERFVLQFGGRVSLTEKSDKILIIDLKNMVIKTSKIRCPTEGNFKALIYNDEEIGELLIVGYIRYCWEMEEFSNVKQLSSDLIRFMQSFYCNEIVHLFKISSGSGHWKINLDDILLSVE